MTNDLRDQLWLSNRLEDFLDHRITRNALGLPLEVENQARNPDHPLDSILLKPVTAEFERVKTALEAERNAWLSQN